MAMLPDGVSWTQDDESVEVTVSVPGGILRENVRVKTTTDTVSVQRRESNCWIPLVTGMLKHNVERESCCWALEKLRDGKLAVVIQLEKAEANVEWDALLRASVSGSILEELGRDQVIVDAGASASESLVCGRCGALVKANRMDAHTEIWCEAISTDSDCRDQSTSVETQPGKMPASHLYWARSPTDPAGSVPPKKLGVLESDGDGQVV